MNVWDSEYSTHTCTTQGLTQQADADTHGESLITAEMTWGTDGAETDQCIHMLVHGFQCRERCYRRAWLKEYDFPHFVWMKYQPLHGQRSQFPFPKTSSYATV